MLDHARRILIIGCGGAGKSTLARRLGERTAIPVVHLDQQYWRPGWREPEPAAWLAHLDELLAAPEWIMDGNYVATLPSRLAVADAVVLFDFARWRCLRGAVLRIARTHGRTRPDMAPGCPERFDLGFFRWIWTFRNEVQPRLLEAIAAAPHVERVELRSPADVERLLGGLSGPSGH